MVCEERREHNGLSFQQLLPGVCFFTFTFYKRQQHDSKGLAIQVQQVMNVLQEVQFQLEMVKRCSNRLLNAKSSYESILMAPPCRLTSLSLSLSTLTYKSKSHLNPAHNALVLKVLS